MFTGFLQLSAQDIRATSTTKAMALGSVGVTRDGRVYRYTKAGGTTLDPGKLTVAATVNSDVTNKTVARTYATGVREVIIDAGGAITANAYADGTLNINDATGEGISYLVVGNTATSGAAELTVTLDEPVMSALTIDVSEASLTKNPWGDTVISVTDQADMPVGIPNVSITNATYGWTQTRGVCAAWADEAITAGLAITTGTGTAGQVEALDAAGEFQIGVALVAAVDTEYREVFLTID
jgi:hypothetical protein